MSQSNPAIKHELLALDVLEQDLHKPIVDGKCNHERISDALFFAIYCGEIGPMTQKDVDFVCQILDDLVYDFRKGKQ